MDEKTLKKTHKILLSILRFTLVIAIILEILNKRWFTLFITFITIILTFLPMFFEKKYKIDIPDSFEILIILFIYSSIYLGEVQQFYLKFWWWDILLHFWSAMALGMIGLTILFILYEKEKISTKPFWISLFVFAFAVSMGTVWEIFEFFMDQVFGTNMQKSGLIDTMADLIVDSIGALIIAIAGYIYIRTNRGTYITNTVERLIKEIKK